ncbi:MAG: GNAT family N-acetyltransferase [Lachnospiraceae bacterium]|nr:GNAT family N-acetyltransferase [Lachnospiraceae bacterium]
MNSDLNVLNINGSSYVLKNAEYDDKSDIMKLYGEAIGTEGCTWSEEYPNEDIFDMDVRGGNLFCFMNESGEIIAAISIDRDAAVDELPCWNKSAGKMGELARMVVRRDYQNRGIAPELINAVVDVMKQRGYATVHYLVSREHKKALASYAKLDFVKVGECELFLNKWLCYEKIIE